jgi:ribosome production factor 1
VHAVQVFPSAQYYKRAGFPLKKICQYATARGFTDVLVANEDRKSVNGLLLIHLPGGPTAHFRLSKLVLSKDIKVGADVEQTPFLGISVWVHVQQSR